MLTLAHKEPCVCLLPLIKITFNHGRNNFQSWSNSYMLTLVHYKSTTCLLMLIKRRLTCGHKTQACRVRNLGLALCNDVLHVCVCVCACAHACKYACIWIRGYLWKLCIYRENMTKKRDTCTFTYIHK
jgi:hypothetical protein